MSGALIKFENSGWQVRALEIDGEPWFVASDVARVLGYQNVSRDVQRHCKAAREINSGQGGTETVLSSSGHGGARRVLVIPERDVYRLIMRSRLPDAEQFEEWVVGEVLPSIRKTGKYDPVPPEVEVARALIAAHQLLEDYRPKAEAYDQIADARGSFTLSDVAKKLGWGPNRFTERLRADGILFHRNQGAGQVNIPYQRHIDMGRFIVRTVNVDPLRQQTRVTGKGELWLATRYAQMGVAA